MMKGLKLTQTHLCRNCGTLAHIHTQTHIHTHTHTHTHTHVYIVKIAVIIARKEIIVVLLGTLKVQSFVLTEVRDCDLLIVVTSSTFLKRKDM